MKKTANIYVLHLMELKINLIFRVLFPGTVFSQRRKQKSSYRITFFTRHNATASCINFSISFSTQSSKKLRRRLIFVVYLNLCRMKRIWQPQMRKVYGVRISNKVFKKPWPYIPLAEGGKLYCQTRGKCTVSKDLFRQILLRIWMSQNLFVLSL